MSDRTVTETSDDTQHSQETSTPLEGFDSAIPASEQPKTHALDRKVTRIAWLIIRS